MEDTEARVVVMEDMAQVLATATVPLEVVTVAAAEEEAVVVEQREDMEDMEAKEGDTEAMDRRTREDMVVATEDMAVLAAVLAGATAVTAAVQEVLLLLRGRALRMGAMAEATEEATVAHTAGATVDHLRPLGQPGEVAVAVVVVVVVVEADHEGDEAVVDTGAVEEHTEASTEPGRILQYTCADGTMLTQCTITDQTDYLWNHVPKDAALAALSCLCSAGSFLIGCMISVGWLWASISMSLSVSLSVLGGNQSPISERAIEVEVGSFAGRRRFHRARGREGLRR